MKKKYRVIADNSAHNLPIGAIVEQVPAPGNYWGWDVQWYSQGGDGDAVAIDPADLEEVTDD